MALNAIKAMREYIAKLVRVTQGMKVLLLDQDTTGMVSVVYSQSEILQEEVYLFERVDSPNREVMAHLKAICFLRPTQENLALLKKELRKPKYGEYYLFFTNVITKQYLEQLASADEHEVVCEVQEFFGDFYAINAELFTLGLGAASCISTKATDWPATLDRVSGGLFAFLLAMKVRPYIRAQKSSELAMQVAKDVLNRMRNNRDLFKFKVSDNPPILLVLDRRDDPVSPLLSQWTYQAMIHELIGLENNLVDMSNFPANTKKEMAQIVLSPEHDPFYRENMFKNFGDLGVAMKELADEYQRTAKLNQNIKSLEDMKKFIASFPEFKKLSGNVSKHWTLMEELQRQVGARKLLDVSELEQTLACHQDQGEAARQLDACFGNPEVQPLDLLRLVMLYSLRYENSPNARIDSFVTKLQEKGLDDDYVKLVGVLKNYAGIQKRSQQIDLFDNKDIFNIARGQILRGLVGVTNIYTQHQPLMARTISDLIKRSLKEMPYPYIEGSPTNTKPQQIIVFVVGGVTYEEALFVSQLNSENPGVSIALGGTSVHNSKTFLQGLLEFKRSREEKSDLKPEGAAK